MLRKLITSNISSSRAFSTQFIKVRGDILNLKYVTAICFNDSKQQLTVFRETNSIFDGNKVYDCDSKKYEEILNKLCIKNEEKISK